MFSKRNHEVWVGALRVVAAIVAAILCLSIITLGLSAAYGTQLASGPLDEYDIAHRGAHRWSNAYFVFYSGTMPFLTILHTALDLFLYFVAMLNPVYALIGSVVFLCGWAVQVGFWAQCDLPAGLENATPGTCYQSHVQKDPKGGDLQGISTGLNNAKVAFGFMVLVLYAAYLSFAAAAVHKNRTQRKNTANMGTSKALEFQEHELNHA